MIESLDDIRALIRDLPAADNTAITEAAARNAVLTKPPGSLGRLEQLAEWVCAWQGRHPPSVDHCRMAIFAGNHGITDEGVSAFPAEVTAQMVGNFEAGGAAINQLCASVGCELQIYPVADLTPTQNFLHQPAMTEDECVASITIGMQSVDEGIDLLCIGEMGIGNTTAAAAICHAVFGGDAETWVGAGTGVAGNALADKIDVVENAVKLHGGNMQDGLEVLRHVGGREIAAMAGAILAARQAKVPVILDGYVCGAAAAALHAMDAAAIDHCITGHVSAEPGHRRMLETTGQRPILDLGMRLGEGSGAAIALSVVQAAVACHNGMASFEQAGVAGSLV